MITEMQAFFYAQLCLWLDEMQRFPGSIEAALYSNIRLTQIVFFTEINVFSC